MTATATAIGIDLAWSPNNPTGLAVATVTQDEVTVLATATAKTNADIIESVRTYTDGPLTIAIDAPTVVPNKAGMRSVERLLESLPEFPKAHAAPYPANDFARQNQQRDTSRRGVGGNPEAGNGGLSR